VARNLPTHTSVPTDTAYHREESLVEVLTARLDVASDALRESAALLSAPERQQAQRLAFARDRRRFIVARARLRQLLGTRLGVRPATIELTSGPYGKPMLAPRFRASDVRFNVSHSADLAVYAFARRREIGVDVEALRTIPDADRISARFFSAGEAAAYAALDPGARPVAFVNCWTRKEAFLKALGGGLSYPLDRVEVSLVPDAPATIVRVADTPGDACGWRLASFTPAPGFVGAVVVEQSLQ
jgi:4'-phosphopantetheinyl transferase